MNLSPHFTLDELMRSDTAQRLGIANTPDAAALANLQRLATTVLEPIRALVGAPVHVHDGYRCPAVNAAVGGVHDSQHAEGEAADLDALPTLTNDHLFDRIRGADIPFDQVILEHSDGGGCVHVSCAKDGQPPRRQALIRTGFPGHWSYMEARPL